MDIIEFSAQLISSWWENLPRYRGGLPVKRILACALIILEHLKDDFNLSLEDNRTGGKSQIQGISGAAAQSILARYGD